MLRRKAPMPRYSIATRALFSSAAMLLLGLILLLPSGLQPISQARPLFQDATATATSTTPTPTINPSVGVDLRVDDDTRFGDPGTQVFYRFTITHNLRDGVA